MRQILPLLAALLLVSGSISAEYVMAHEHGMKHDEHQDMEHGEDHHGMSTDGKMYLLGTHEVDGVKGMAHINDVRKQMAEHGMAQTHHLMIAFEDLASGEAINSGTVAVKIETPDEQVIGPLKMMGMDGHFGIDLTLKRKGLYHFKIGTRLADGKKRTFHHHFDYQ